MMTVRAFHRVSSTEDRAEPFTLTFAHFRNRPGRKIPPPIFDLGQLRPQSPLPLQGFPLLPFNRIML